MLNLLIPLAGDGSRFKKAGFNDPKPFIDINGQPMIERVIKNLALEDPYKLILIVNKNHYKGNFDREWLQTLHTPIDIVEIHEKTEGAACTVLKAQTNIENSNELIIANSDQLINQPLQNSINYARENELDGLILTTVSDEEKWSYSLTNEDNLVVRVEEKKVISPHATIGIYYFKHGSDFVSGAKSMIAKNIRTQGEFYVAPVYNEIIARNCRVENFYIGEIHQDFFGLGTPEDLLKYLERSKKLAL